MQIDWTEEQIALGELETQLSEPLPEAGFDDRSWLQQNGFADVNGDVRWDRVNPFHGTWDRLRGMTLDEFVADIDEASRAIPLGTPVAAAVTGSVRALSAAGARLAASNARHAAAVQAMAKWLSEGGYVTRIRPRNWLDVPRFFRYPDIEVWEPLAGNTKVLVGFVEVKTGGAFRSFAQRWKDAYMALQGIPTQVASFPNGPP